MSEEEKKAVGKFKKLGLKTFREEKINENDKLDYFEFVTVLNCIDRLQKKLKQEKGKNKKMQDKIKDKIKEIVRQQDYYREKGEIDEYYAKIEVLEDILKEN